MSAAPPLEKSPLLAALLSVIPGLGQIYNEEYSKGLVLLLVLFGGFFIFVTGWSLLWFPPFSNWALEGSYSTTVSVFRMLFIFIILPAIYLFAFLDAIFSAQRINRQIRGQQVPSAAGAMGAGPAQPNQSIQPAGPASESAATGAETMNTEHEQASQTPPPSQTEAKAKPQSSVSGRMVLGILLFAVGTIFALDNHFPQFRWENLWPLIPLGLGLRLLFDAQRRQDRGQLILGTVLTVIGAVFMLELWTPVSLFGFFELSLEAFIDLFEYLLTYWYFVLMAVGALILVEEIIRRRHWKK